MVDEFIRLNVSDKSGKITQIVLELNDESPDDSEKVRITANGVSYDADNYFDAMLSVRAALEKKSMQLICFGACMEIYPSEMQFSMGDCRTAYIQQMGKPASKKDIVDIFDYDGRFTPCDIADQMEYHRKWTESLSDEDEIMPEIL